MPFLGTPKAHLLAATTLLAVASGCTSAGATANPPSPPPPPSSEPATPVPSSSEPTPPPPPTPPAKPVPSTPKWAEPPSYAFTLTTGCTRGFYEARYRVEVENGEVRSSTPLNDQAEAHAGFPAPTLGDIDTWIDKQEPHNPRLRRQRDPHDGHPLAFGFDQQAMAYDGGTCYAVTDYHP
ncbi:DUF6174 domain-containing protein [Actinoplanes sp. CA-015351]|uniref:DUF6174 domain-containing protein n=1 Tax=Actinoplanes sp. CA-015351 TaxID=3239897 RepID=UPI003D97C86A